MNDVNGGAYSSFGMCEVEWTCPAGSACAVGSPSKVCDSRVDAGCWRDTPLQCAWFPVSAATPPPHLTPPTSVSPLFPGQMLCPAGTSSPGGAGNVSCSTCPRGTYSTTGAAACLPCTAGYVCNGTGSPTPTQYACPMGTYSTSGASTCLPCPSGTYGASTALPNASCSGLCPAGYACVPGSTNATAALCGPGTYSPGGTSACIPCPAGRYGSQFGAISSSCTGPCNVSGSYCPPLSTSLADARPCPPGSFGNATSGQCVACPPAAPYSRARSTSTGNCSSCAGGCEGGYGVLACNDTTWTAWVDGDGLEGINSCLAVVGPAVSWTTANASCAALGTGIHLLTTSQVR